MLDYLETEKLIAKLKVMGIGGAGLNAVNAMIDDQISGVQFIVVSTSAARLRKSKADTNVQIGCDVRGFGTGGDPEVARKAAMESSQNIRQQLEGADLVFLVAGLGSGTGTGATPVIAGLAKAAGALVVGIVTKPFSREGKRRMDLANRGIRELATLADCLIVIPNDRLISISGKGISLLEAFKPADDLLRQAVQGITEIISEHGHINVDFSDVRTVLGAKGMALIGIGAASGENRAAEAATRAIQNPLLEELDMQGAKGVLLNISASSDMTLDEFDQVCKTVTDKVAEDAIIIVGMVVNEALGGQIKVTVIATGLKGLNGASADPSESKNKMGQLIALKPADLDIPTYIRRKKNNPGSDKDGSHHEKL